MIKLIDYYADWCAPCKIMEPIFEEVEKEFTGKVEFERVDVDKNQQRAVDAGVMSIPTFVIEKDGKELDRRVGASPKERLQQWIEFYI